MKKNILSLILIISFACAYIFMNSKKNEAIVFAVPQLPFSSDPMDYDDYAHHHALTSVFAKLVSINRNGEIFPDLSYRWVNEDNFKRWHFYIRKNITYSNGDLITIEDIKNNFKRIAYLKKIEKSESGFLEFLVGFETIKSPLDEIDGIKIDNDKITFEFRKEMPNALEKLSFGFYSLAHPTLYDHQNGKWKDTKKVIASGKYNVDEWSDDKFSLVFRTDIPSSDRDIRSIIFKEVRTIKSIEDLSEIDILAADQKTTLVDNEFIFNGSTTGLKIGYVECYSWKDDSNPLSNLNVRKWFRQKFYEGLKKEDFPITQSFFPLELKGVEEINDDSKVEKPKFSPYTISTAKIPKPMTIKGQVYKKSLSEIFSSAMSNLGENSGANIDFKEYDSNRKFDFLINGTGIEALEYWDTVKFMFKSKQGIQLPDMNGKIFAELEKKSPDINAINKELWEQAIIWPIRHYTSGFWFRKKSRIDYSKMNFNSPSIDFQFLKWN